ncbi:MAG: hypothetical protein ACO1O1_09045 [Adhaeribacter sp.]
MSGPDLHQHLPSLLWLAGLTQIGLALGSLAIPRILNWRQALAPAPPLIRQMFRTYAAYILGINLGFGLLSLLACRELANGSVLALALTGFISLYWISRLGIQFFYFERSAFPAGRLLLLGEIVLVALFVFLAAVYAGAFYLNFYLHGS